MNNVRCPVREVMGILTIEDIITATGGKVIYGNSNTFTGVSIDSRTIKEGELFIALKGGRFDGHNFLHEALKRGSGSLVNIYPGEPVNGKTIIYVNNTLRALQEIARYMRLKKDIPVIAVTGSNGKTTTKELIASILSTGYRLLKNTGNLNNNIGLPLSLTRISDEEEIVVLEMGASGPGEIKELCEIAVPNYGVLTNISQTHLEGFKDLETVRKTKLELLDYIRVAVVNADDPFLMEGIPLSGFKGNVISDVYNANPASMEEAIKELVRIRKGRIIAVLGDMLELGSYEEEAHRRLGRLMSGLTVDIFIAVGARMAFAASEFSGSVYKLQNAIEAGKLLKEISREGDTVLIKGSRGMNMDKVLEA